jgi:hypothetical protein
MSNETNSNRDLPWSLARSTCFSALSERRFLEKLSTSAAMDVVVLRISASSGLVGVAIHLPWLSDCIMVAGECSTV